MDIYSFQTTVLLVNGVEIEGAAEGDDVISITRLNDSASHKVGADGKMAVALSTDKSGEVTFRLMQTSPSNKYLNMLLDRQEGGPATFQPVSVMFQDTHRQDVAGGTHGYIKKRPDITRGAGINPQEWTIVVESLEELLGAPVGAGFATAAAGAR